jgi:hypothetical protein
MTKKCKVLDDVERVVTELLEALNGKFLSHYLVKYIHQNILLPRVTHIIGPNIIKKQRLLQLGRRWMKGLKKLLNYKSRIMNIVLYSELFFGLEEIHNRIIMCKVKKSQMWMV